MMEVSCRIGSRKVPAVLLLLLLTMCVACQNVNIPRPPRYDTVNRSRRLMRLVTEPPLADDNQQSPLLLPTVPPTPNPIHIIWYGTFSEEQKRIVLDFFNSFHPSPEVKEERATFSGPPSVESWWRPIAGSSGMQARVHLESEISDTSYLKGRNLSTADVEDLVLHFSQDSLQENPSTLFLVLTSDDVAIEGFCVNSCASRSRLSVDGPSPTPEDSQVVRKLTSTAIYSPRVVQFAWVGNSASQCARECAWPLAEPGEQGERMGPPLGAVLSPNGDIGMDGMVINIATILAGAASATPFRQRTRPLVDEGVVLGGSASLETGVVCRGVFGEGAYTGYPGRLWKEKVSGTSFNAVGVNEHRYLLPALWDPSTHKCTIPS